MPKFIILYFPGYIELEDEESKIKTPIRTVRCGITAPIAKNEGGYFCLVGQEQRRLITGQRALRFLEDHEFKTTFQLLTTVFDRMGIYQSTEMWTDFSSRFHPFIEQVDLFWRQNRTSQEISLNPAPYASDFVVGERIVAKWVREIKGGLVLPKESIVRNQLREIKTEDLGHAPEEKFYAINGLRYVLASFEAADFTGRASAAPTKDLPTEAWT